GRTDTGVHALGQVAHVDLARDWSGERLRNALNAHLRPAPVSVLAAAPVAADFDARFSALRRHYRYRIASRPAPLAVERARAGHVSRPLSAVHMRRAAQGLLGTHDCATFRSVHGQSRSPLKTLARLDVTRMGDEILVGATARSFLHNQVRS